MVGTALTKDGGAFFTAADGICGTATAGGTGDATAINGAWIDKSDFASAKIIAAWTAVLANAKTLSLAMKLQDADDSSGTNSADFGTGLASTVVKTAGSSATFSGANETDWNIEGARQWIRMVVTPDLSNTTTDTLTIGCVLALAGKREEAASKRLN